MIFSTKFINVRVLRILSVPFFSKPVGDGQLTWKEYYNITYGFVNPGELDTNNLANGHNSYSEVNVRTGMKLG